MYDVRLFYPQVSIDQARARRPVQGHATDRIHRLDGIRRPERRDGRR